MGQLSGLVVWFGGIGAVAGSIIGGFAWLEGTASAQAKTAAAAWLKRTELRNLSWSDQFLVLFDRVFGKQLMTWKSFFRCVLVSFAMCMMLTVVWCALRPSEFSNFWYGVTHSLSGAFPLDWGPGVLIRPICIFLLINIPGDYVSLLVSRKIMGLALKRRSRLKWAMALLGGTIGCIFVYAALFIAFLIVMLAIEAIIRGETFGLISFDYIYNFAFLYFWRGFEFNPRLWVLFNHYPSAGIFIYTSLFAVSWMWLFLAAGWTVRLLGWIDPGWQKLKWFFDIDNQPLKSLGIVAGVIGAVMFSLIKLAVG